MSVSSHSDSPQLLLRYLHAYSDIPIAEYIRHLNSQARGAEQFVIQFLDETHILIQAEYAAMLRLKIQEWRDKHTYQRPLE